MCRSLAEGGQRCSAHTTPKYLAVMTKVYEHGPYVVTSEDMEALSDHASTRRGGAEIKTLHDDLLLSQPIVEANMVLAEADGDTERLQKLQEELETTVHLQALMQTALKHGHDKYEAAKQVREEYLAAHPEVREQQEKEAQARKAEKAAALKKALAAAGQPASDANFETVYGQLEDEWKQMVDAGDVALVNPDLLKQRNDAFRNAMTNPSAETQMELTRSLIAIKESAVTPEQKAYVKATNEKLMALVISASINFFQKGS